MVPRGAGTNLATLVLTSGPLGVALAVMVRYAALLRARAVTAVGALAVAGITSSALSLLHDFDATVIILIRNIGTATFITGLGSMFGERALGHTMSRLPVT
jgi:hypothetical protein